MRFLTTKQISGEIERLIREARQLVVLISPYVKLSQMYLHRLVEADKNGVKLHFVFSKQHLGELEEEKLSSIPQIQLYFLENLHAKCYLNENDAVITSMNLHDYSENNNREMGLLVSKQDNAREYGDIIREAQSIIQNATKHLLQRVRPTISPQQQPIKLTGHCIRCGIDIERNSDRPLCDKCHSVWAEFLNYEYTERYCHFCGDPWGASMARPLCNTCLFSKS